MWRQRYPFPDPRGASEEGLVAWGGDLAPGRLLAAYESGVFPWYEEGPVLWFSPDPRWLLRPGGVRVSRSLERCLRRGAFELRVDTAFEAVIHACARVPRRGQAGTWINADMIEAYCELHRLGYAHSFESWSGDELVGGLYGVSLGAAFFGESMFSLRPDASKVALFHLSSMLRAWDFAFIDCQVHTAHLERLGARPCARDDFLSELEKALRVETRCGAWRPCASA